jgi:signal transduction histidine kinase
MSVLERVLGASSPQQPLAERLPRRRRTIALGIAVVVPLLITLTSRLLGPSVPPASVLFASLLVVGVVALIGGAYPALTAVLVSLAAQEIFFRFPYGSLTDRQPAQVSVLIGFVVIGAGLGLLVDELGRLTREQAALRRIATLVAHGVPAPELFSAVAGEVAALLAADSAFVGHLEPDGRVTVLAGRGRGAAAVVIGERREVPPHSAVATVALSARPARTDDDKHASPEARELMRSVGMRSNVATPIIVDGRLWGVIAASSTDSLAADCEQRMVNFTELVATAIANAESRSELAASRARIVSAADETRRRVERDLHDGVQQRLVSLALEVRAAQSALPPAAGEVRSELTHVVDGLTGALDELREIARGIHPAILSEGGLGPALKTLARRSAIPVELDVLVEGRLRDSVEVAAYYAISEMITNAAKHAQASSVTVDVVCANRTLRIMARDDGVGGADPARGSGLVGLRDRIEALGGTISVQSPRGEGTAVEVTLPFDGERQAADLKPTLPAATT